MNDPKLTDPVEEVVRRVAGNVYVIAGAGGNIVVQAGPDGLFLVDDNFAVFYPKIMAALRQISDKPVRISSTRTGILITTRTMQISRSKAL